MGKQWRAYQSWAAKEMADCMKREVPALLVMATGTGKTYTMLEAVNRMRLPHTRILILAHRTFLLDQWREAIEESFPHFGKIARYGQENINHAPVILSTIQTATHKNRKSGKYERAADLLYEYLLPGNGGLDILIIDEAHRSVGSFSYPFFISMMQGQFPNLSLVGCTATSHRTDGSPMSELYIEAPVVIDTGLAQEWGYLAQHKVIPIYADSYDDPQYVNGNDSFDYRLGHTVLDNPDADRKVYNEWKAQRDERGRWLPTMGFCGSVAHAKNISAFFKAQGISSTWVGYKLGKKENERRDNAFKNGEVEMIWSVMRLTEGFDAPHAEAAIFNRLTKSELVTIQTSGRVLRLFEGKENALIFQVMTEGQEVMDIDAVLSDGIAYPLD